MKEITVNFEELYQCILEMKQDGISVAHIAIMEPDAHPVDPLPACLLLSGYSSSDPDCEVEYDEIEAMADSEAE